MALSTKLCLVLGTTRVNAHLSDVCPTTMEEPEKEDKTPKKEKKKKNTNK